MFSGWTVKWEPFLLVDWEDSFFSALMISVCLALSTALSFEKSIPTIDKGRFRGFTQ